MTMPGSVSLSDRQPPLVPGQQGAAGSITGEMMVSGSGSMVLPAGIINPSVPIRNIKMKFAVLIGLIQVGEVSNRDIVETVLNLVRKSFISLINGQHCLLMYPVGMLPCMSVIITSCGWMRGINCMQI